MCIYLSHACRQLFSLFERNITIYHTVDDGFTIRRKISVQIQQLLFRNVKINAGAADCPVRKAQYVINGYTIKVGKYPQHIAGNILAVLIG